MFDNDIRGQQLVAELKEWTCLRDKQLEHNVRADGSVRVIGFKRVSGRRLMYVANQYGKNASFIMDTAENRCVEIDFQDDIAWSPVAGRPAGANSLITLINETLGKTVSVKEVTDAGATNVLVIRAVSPIKVSHKFVRAVLSCPNVIDISVTRTYCNIMMARKSNMVGGLAHIGATTGFQFTRRANNNGAGKSRIKTRRRTQK